MFSPVTNSVADNTPLKMRKATQTIKLDAAGMRVISGFFADFCFQLVILYIFFYKKKYINFTNFYFNLLILIYFTNFSLGPVSLID